MYKFWRCKICKSIQCSISGRRHSLDACKCNSSFVDLEEEYSRYGGDIEFLFNLDYNFFDEILRCMIEQDIDIPVALIDVYGVDYLVTDFSFIRDLEDKLIKELI